MPARPMVGERYLPLARFAPLGGQPSPQTDLGTKAGRQIRLSPSFGRNLHFSLNSALKFPDQISGECPRSTDRQDDSDHDRSAL